MIAVRELRRITTNTPLIVGLILVTALVTIGALGPLLAPYDPNATTSLILRFAPDGSAIPVNPPTLPDLQHWLGTDPKGRDQLSRVMTGAWLTLSVVLISTAVRIAAGVLFGALAGWYTRASYVVRLATRGVAAIPQLVLAIMLVLATRPLGAFGFIFSLAVVGWPEVAELVTAEVRRRKAEPFMEAARALGARDRRLITTHVFAVLAPQLLTVAALETGAVLLLLAELGLVGLFISGATFLVGEFGPIGPFLGRMPELGQMVGAIQFYAITSQLSTLLPAAFVVLAAVAFTLLADGLRAASDPYDTRALRPTTFRVLSRVLVGAMCFSAVGFVGLRLPTTGLSMEQGRALAAATASRTWPGSVLVAGVARYISPAQGFGRPNRLSYYYRNDRNEVLRITYVSADPLAVEVGPYEIEDDLDFPAFRPLPEGLAPYDVPTFIANQRGGGELRAAMGLTVIRAIVTWPPGRAGPVYTITMGQPRVLTIQRFCCFDARTGAPDQGAAWSFR